MNPRPSSQKASYYETPCNSPQFTLMLTSDDPRSVISVLNFLHLSLFSVAVKNSKHTQHQPKNSVVFLPQCVDRFCCDCVTSAIFEKSGKAMYQQALRYTPQIVRRSNTSDMFFTELRSINTVFHKTEQQFLYY
jgi:hypothetical protein